MSWEIYLAMNFKRFARGYNSNSANASTEVTHRNDRVYKHHTQSFKINSLND